MKLSTRNLQRWIFQKNVSLSSIVILLHLIRYRTQSSVHKSFHVCSICTVCGWDWSALDTVYIKEKKYYSVKKRKRERKEYSCATGTTFTSIACNQEQDPNGVWKMKEAASSKFI